MSSSNSSATAALKINEEKIFVKIPSASGKGLCAIVTAPPALYHEDFYAKGYEPSTHKMVIIVHGSGGHKNYCYQAILAQKLLAELGIFSIRFDFRGCGDSQDNFDLSKGRTIEQDVEDLDTIARYVTSGAFRDTRFSVSGIVAHSRGSAAMFLWALRQQQILESGEQHSRIYVPNLINCACRFDFQKHLLRVKSSHPNWEQERCYQLHNVYRDGSYGTVTVPRSETLSLASVELSLLKDLNCDVMSIYGLQDKAIPVEDAASFANILGDRHHLRLIKNADHNYYGHDPTDEVYTEINSRGEYNYNFYVAELIKNYMSHALELLRFYNRCKNITSSPRWKHVEGIANFRDIGGWRISTEEYVRPNFGFRSALPSKVTPLGKETIKLLNIKLVFDFRSDGECLKDGVLDVEGVTRYHVPVFRREKGGKPEDLLMMYSNLFTSWATYKDIYKDMLDSGIQSYKQVFLHIRDHPTEGFLFHCSAGKDRTGVMGMLIYLVCGLDNLLIAKEYELTTIGLQPMIPQMKHDFQHSLKLLKDKVDHVQDKIAFGRKNWSLAVDGFNNMISSRCEAMLLTIDMFNTIYGGVNNYLEQMGFTKADIDTIRDNLTINRSSL